MSVVAAPGILLLLALLGGNQADLLSLLEAEDYFRQHEVEVKVSTMLDRAGKAPMDGPSQAAQLLAIRWLGDQPAAGKDAKVRALLTQIAEGKKAQDAQGFARDYARRALAQLDGKPAPGVPLPANSLRADALAWFPDGVTIAGGIDLRGSGPQLLDDPRIRKLLRAKPFMPPAKRDQTNAALIKYADQFGNIEIQRFAFAVRETDPKDSGKDMIFFRLTGRADRKRLVDFIRSNLPGAEGEDEKGTKGPAITILRSAKSPPALAVVGDTDLLTAGFSADAGNHLEVLREALDVLAGKKPAATKGKLAALLKDASPDASGLLIGALTARQGREIAGPTPLAFEAKELFAEVIRKNDIAVKARLRVSDADRAKQLVDILVNQKRLAEKHLDDVPADFKIPKGVVEDAKKAIAGAKVYSDEDTIHAQATIPGTVLKQLPELLKQWLERDHHRDRRERFLANEASA